MHKSIKSFDINTEGKFCCKLIMHDFNSLREWYLGIPYKITIMWIYTLGRNKNYQPLTDVLFCKSKMTLDIHVCSQRKTTTNNDPVRRSREQMPKGFNNGSNYRTPVPLENRLPVSCKPRRGQTYYRVVIAIMYQNLMNSIEIIRDKRCLHRSVPKECFPTLEQWRCNFSCTFVTYKSIYFILISTINWSRYNFCLL